MTRAAVLGLLFLLSSCTALSPAPTFEDSDYQQKLRTLDTWSLRGRLNIRSGNNSNTININWQQDNAAFEINLSGTLGLGAVRLSGNQQRVLVEKAGEDPVMAGSLAALGSEILGYAFPANELLYWIRGLAAPGSRPQFTYDADGLVATLSQADGGGRVWELQYDRYRNVQGYYLPGRLRLEQLPYRLTFLIADWDLPVATQP